MRRHLAVPVLCSKEVSGKEVESYVVLSWSPAFTRATFKIELDSLTFWRPLEAGVHRILMHFCLILPLGRSFRFNWWFATVKIECDSWFLNLLEDFRSCAVACRVWMHFCFILQLDRSFCFTWLLNDRFALVRCSSLEQLHCLPNRGPPDNEMPLKTQELRCSAKLAASEC